MYSKILETKVRFSCSSQEIGLTMIFTNVGLSDHSYK